MTIGESARAEPYREIEFAPRLRLIREVYGAYVIQQDRLLVALKPREVILQDSELRALAKAIEEMLRDGKR